MEVAKTIVKQIGNRALMMIGAKNLCRSDNSLSFKIGRNSKGVNFIKIRLTSADLYDMTFGRIRAGKMTILNEESGIYCDMLNSLIESNTGMATRLF